MNNDFGNRFKILIKTLSDPFGNNLGIKRRFSKYLKGGCLLGSSKILLEAFS